jgi:hypothetical protein
MKETCQKCGAPLFGKDYQVSRFASTEVGVDVAECLGCGFRFPVPSAWKMKKVGEMGRGIYEVLKGK